MKRVTGTFDRGFSLVEVVIGATLLALVAFGFYQFQVQTSKSVRIVSDQAAMARALVVIEKDIMADMPFLPPQETDQVDPESPTSPFRDPAVRGERCYDKFGSLVTTCANFETDNSVYFRTLFYKARVQDASLDPGSPHNRIPLSRVRFQVEYKVNDRVQQPLYFARLFTETVRF